MDKIEAFELIVLKFEQMTYKNSQEKEQLLRSFEVLLAKYLDNSAYYTEKINKITFNPYIAFKREMDIPDHLYDINDLEVSESDWRKQWDTGYAATLKLMVEVVEELKMLDSIDRGAMTETHEKDLSKVFIVHGHDDGAKNEVARFVEKLRLEAVILHEQVNSGDTIIEKLEKHTDVGFAIVLYTSCDIGGVKTEPDKLKPRARQNVVFEHGLLIGKIGRANVIALVKEEVETPNDVSGVVYETMDSKGAWKFQLAREIKASGYDIDMNKVY